MSRNVPHLIQMSSDQIPASQSSTPRSQALVFYDATFDPHMGGNWGLAATVANGYSYVFISPLAWH